MKKTNKDFLIDHMIPINWGLGGYFDAYDVFTSNDADVFLRSENLKGIIDDLKTRPVKFPLSFLNRIDDEETKDTAN